MTGFKWWTSDIGCDCSTNCATTTSKFIIVIYHSRVLPEIYIFVQIQASIKTVFQFRWKKMKLEDELSKMK